MPMRLPALPDSIAATISPHWAPENLVHRNCPVCNGDQPKALCQRPDELFVHTCSACGMVYLAEIPSPAELDRFYARYRELKGRQHFLKPSNFQKYLQAKLDFRVQVLEKRGGLRGKQLLEVGCGGGFFLQLCSYQGATVSAVELDSEALKFLSGLGYSVSSTVEKTAQYDIVCAFDVLEHLADPAAMIAAMARALKPDGRLLLSMPNGGEISKSGPTWVGFRVDPEHLNYFNLKTLGQLLAGHNLYIEHYWEYMQPNLNRPEAGAAKSSRLSWAIERISLIILPLLFRVNPHLATQGSFAFMVLANKG